jgi:hypothetical protein
MSTLIIEPKTKEDERLFVNLAKRLDAKYRRGDKKSVLKPTKPQNEISSYFGALSDIDAEQMIKDINEAKTIKDIDTSWAE